MTIDSVAQIGGDALAPRWLLITALVSMPLPWLAAELGWILAETGRQPWIIDGVLPTFMGVSTLSAGEIILTMVGFTLIYGVLAVINVSLMVRAISAGPGAPQPFARRRRPSARATSQPTFDH